VCNWCLLPLHKLGDKTDTSPSATESPQPSSASSAFSVVNSQPLSDHQNSLCSLEKETGNSTQIKERLGPDLHRFLPSGGGAFD
jgi:hypothetical protein